MPNVLLRAVSRWHISLQWRLWLCWDIKVDEGNRKWRSLPPAPLHVDWEKCQGKLRFVVRSCFVQQKDMFQDVAGKFSIRHISRMIKAVSSCFIVLILFSFLSMAVCVHTLNCHGLPHLYRSRACGGRFGWCDLATRCRRRSGFEETAPWWHNTWSCPWMSWQTKNEGPSEIREYGCFSK